MDTSDLQVHYHYMMCSNDFKDKTDQLMWKGFLNIREKQR